jgi:hypothetical protein
MPFGVSRSAKLQAPTVYRTGLSSPSSASYKLPGGNIQRSASSVILPTSMEARPRDLHPETWEVPVTTLVVSAD